MEKYNQQMQNVGCFWLISCFYKSKTRTSVKSETAVGLLDTHVDPRPISCVAMPARFFGWL